MPKPTRNFARRIGATKAADGRHQSDKIWKAMRMLRRFSADDIAAVVETSPRSTVAHYAKKLTLTGFLRASRADVRSRMHYVLVRDSGPTAPSLIKRRKAIYDHNTSTEYPLDDHA